MSKLIDLFPPCTIDNCKDAAKGTHKHIMPKQQEFLDSSERFVACVGGYGSGKTMQACIMGHLLSVSIHGNMGIVVRKSIPKLHDSTERIYLEILQRSGVNFQAREMRDGWPGRIIYSNGSEVLFRETKDLGRFLGPEYGWFYIDEAQEEPERTWRDLVGRLRLPRAKKYLRGIITTNPPPKTHWIAKKWPTPGASVERVKLKGNKVMTLTYRMIQSSTYDNPFLSSDYIAGIMQNNSPAEARRIIEGFYGFTQEGRAVYPMFDAMRHVGDPPTRKMALYRVWDFGFHCPAVIWSQMFRCKNNSQHCVTLSEYMGQDIEALPLSDEVFKETREQYSSSDIPDDMILDGGDTAGAQHNDRGPGPIILLARPKDQGGKNLHFRHKKFPDIDPGLDLVRLCLRTQCKCGHPLLLIHRRCRNLIEALMGGYHYPKDSLAGSTNKKSKPVKDGYYDNIADVLRYTLELFYRPLSREQNEDILALLDADQKTVEEPWGWMDQVTNYGRPI